MSALPPWFGIDPRLVFQDTRCKVICVRALGVYAVARVETKGASNPWNIEWLSVPVGSDSLFRSPYSGDYFWDAFDNWPQGWEWRDL